MEDQAKRNMAMFSDAMKMFNPFAAAMSMGEKPKSSQGDAPPAEKDDLQTLKEQMAAMQEKINNLGK
jgi:polyhydroxyalkanoate synthesis regulator protein